MIACDILAAAIGIQPRKGLAQAAGIQVERGILVNEYLQTSTADIFAAGDVAQVFDPASGQAVLDSLWTPARLQGDAAGLNMAGSWQPYRKGMPFNVTRLADITTTIIGTVGKGKDADLAGIARGDSETWRFMPDALTAQVEHEVNRLRVVVGEKTILGAIIMGDQSLSLPLQKIIAGQVDITPIRQRLLQPGAHSLAKILIAFWTETFGTKNSRDRESRGRKCEASCTGKENRFGKENRIARQSNRELWLALLAMLLISLIYGFVVLAWRRVPPASDFFGHMIGVLGFILMLMTETLFSLRKRSRSARWGRMSNWLNFHIFTGIVGPFMVLLHTSWKFNGLAGAVTLMTLIVVASGFIGRFIYTSIPRTVDGFRSGSRSYRGRDCRHSSHAANRRRNSNVQDQSAAQTAKRLTPPGSFAGDGAAHDVAVAHGAYSNWDGLVCGGFRAYLRGVVLCYISTLNPIEQLFDCCAVALHNNQSCTAQRSKLNKSC